MDKQNNMNPKRKSKVGAIVIAGTLVLALAGCSVNPGSSQKNKSTTSANGETTASGAAEGLTISVGELTATPTFYPYQAGKTPMEVIALKASDGTVRTAFNTCQVCNNSGRGYYKLEGDTLVCQNCGNRFKPDQVEKEKGGCNPVPITDDLKTENNGQIAISADTLQQASVLFQNWKSQ